MRMSVPHAESFVAALSELIELLTIPADFETIQHVFSSLCLFAVEGNVELVNSGDALAANDLRMHQDAEDTRALVESMRWHGIAILFVDWSAEPEELLQLARLLGERPSSGQSIDDPFDSRAHRAGCWHVVVRMHESTAQERDLESQGQCEEVHPAVALANGCTSAAQALGLAETIAEHARDLQTAGDAVRITRLLRDVLHAETALNNACGPAADVRKVWSDTFSRIASGDALELVTQLLPSRGRVEPCVLAVLARAGDTAATVLIHRLLAAQHLSERRVLYDTVVHVRAGFATLVRCLDHTQWHVVRNAALLLGSMRVRGVERVLARSLKHRDARVRLAVVTALSEIASLSALILVETAMIDRDSAVRLRAFRSLQTRSDYRLSAQSIADALDVERSADIQIQLLEALVQVRDTNVVPKLMRFCTPGHHRRFSADVRMTLLETLVKLRPTPAKPLLRLARHDRDPRIREQAQRLFGEAARPHVVITERLRSIALC